MTGASVRKEGFGLLGVGVVACLACCAGPILGVLGGISVAGLASTTFIGWAGLVVAALAASAWLIISRRRVRRCTAPESVPVDLRVRSSPISDATDDTWRHGHR